MEIVIEIGGMVAGPPYRVRSFPKTDLDKRGNIQFYEVPLFSVDVWKARSHRDPTTYTEKQAFKAVRFGIYHNDGSYNEYRAKGMFVVGLAEDRWHKLTIYKDYKLHSHPSPDNGAWVIEGTHYIHSGPQSINDLGFGTAGCVEIFGPKEFSRFCEVLMRYSGARTKQSVPHAAQVWIHVKSVTRPPIKIAAS